MHQGSRKRLKLTFRWYRVFVHLLRQVLLLLEDEEDGNAQRMAPQQFHAELRSSSGVHYDEVQSAGR